MKNLSPGPPAAKKLYRPSLSFPRISILLYEEELISIFQSDAAGTSHASVRIFRDGSFRYAVLTALALEVRSSQISFPPSSSKFRPKNAVQTPFFCMFLHFFAFSPPRGNMGVRSRCFGGRGNSGCFDVLFWRPVPGKEI
jgi:hypothetical protein